MSTLRKQAIIMRGLPGSGKTPRARELAGSEGVIHSTADFFGVGEDYQYEYRDLQKYHGLNFRAFCESLEDGKPVVICDNTNVCHWEYRNYIDQALAHGYEVHIEVMPCPDPEAAAAEGVHHVPAEEIRRMLQKWQF